MHGAAPNMDRHSRHTPHPAGRALDLHGDRPNAGVKGPGVRPAPVLNSTPPPPPTNIVT